jgi:hypothetical protein
MILRFWGNTFYTPHSPVSNWVLLLPLTLLSFITAWSVSHFLLLSFQNKLTLHRLELRAYKQSCQSKSTCMSDLCSLLFPTYHLSTSISLFLHPTNLWLSQAHCLIIYLLLLLLPITPLLSQSHHRSNQAVCLCWLYLSLLLQCHYWTYWIHPHLVNVYPSVMSLILWEMLLSRTSLFSSFMSHLFVFSQVCLW